MRKDIKNSINRLQEILISPVFSLPIFVRFRTPDSYNMIGVKTMVENDGLYIIDSNDGKSLSIDPKNLLSIDVFNDAVGKPVFIKDYDGESTFYATHLYENEILENALHYEIIKWQESLLDVAQIKKENPANCKSAPLISVARTIWNDIVSQRVDDSLDIMESLRAA